MCALIETAIAQQRLDNGLTVTVESRPHHPAVALNIWYRVGSQHEQPTRTGLAHLFEHLMFEGSSHVASGEHIALLEPLGAQVNATTSFERTNYFETVPAGALDLALWLEADRLATLPKALDYDKLNIQRDVVKNERRESYDNQPYGTAWEHLFAALFADGHPYNHMPIGFMADLDAASLEDVSNFFARFYRPDNAFLTIVGDIEPGNAFDRVQRFFGGISTTTSDDCVIAELPASLEPLEQPWRAVIVDETVPASHIFRSWRGPVDGTPEGDAVALALSVLGDGPDSRLFDSLVRRDNIAQPGLGTLFHGLPEGNSAAFVAIPVAEGADTARCEAELDAQLDRFISDGPSDAELRAAKARFEHSRLRQMASLGGRADELSHHACIWSDAAGVDRVVDRVRSADAALVAEAAARWLRPHASATVSYDCSNGVRR